MTGDCIPFHQSWAVVNLAQCEAFAGDWIISVNGWLGACGSYQDLAFTLM